MVNRVFLKEIADVRVGYQSRSRIESSREGTYRIIQSRDFDEDNNLILNMLIRFEPKHNPEPYAIHKGDILFQARGTEHFSYYIEDEMNNTLASNSFYIIRLMGKDISPKFLCWYLNQKPAQFYFQSQASITAISFISKNVLEQLELEVPPLNTQQTIVRAYELWEREQWLSRKLTETRARLIEALSMNAIQGKGEVSNDR